MVVRCLGYLEGWRCALALALRRGENGDWEGVLMIPETTRKIGVMAFVRGRVVRVYSRTPGKPTSPVQSSS